MHKPLWKETLRLWFFGLLKVPMIFWVKPKVLALSDDYAIIKISNKRKTKNHLNSMYFGSLCVGADIAGGAHLLHFLKGNLKKFSFAFKDFHADFLRRPEADVYFISQDGTLIRQTIDKAIQSGERENVQIHVIATTPSLSGDEPVATFTLTLSIKKR